MNGAVRFAREWLLPAERDEAFVAWLERRARTLQAILGAAQVVLALVSLTAESTGAYGVVLLHVSALTFLAAWRHRGPYRLMLLLLTAAWVLAGGLGRAVWTPGILLWVTAAIAGIPAAWLGAAAALYVVESGSAAALGLSLGAVLFAALAYRLRLIEFRELEQELRDAEVLSSAQLRVMLSENAGAVARLAAAITHEVNSPLGALSSAVQTLASVSERLGAAPRPERPRLEALRDQLRASVDESMTRLQGVVERLRTLVDLDSSEARTLCPSDLLHNLAVMFEADAGRIEYRLERTPEITCRPQQMTSVFTTLVRNALDALDPQGGGRVVVTASARPGEVEIAFADNGRGMTPAQVENVFKPSFKVDGGRVAAGNWSLFHARQIVFEHGGDILIDSAAGKGTTVTVRLPSFNESAPAPRSESQTLPELRSSAGDS